MDKEQACYLLVKRGLYYRPDNQGYTGIKEYAGRYQASEASPADGVLAVHENDAPEYSEACFHDLMAKHAAEKVAALREELAALRGAIERVRDGYKSQMRFCDIEALGYFREFVGRIDFAILHTCKPLSSAEDSQ